jgi:excisionase family DNA binding protein
MEARLMNYETASEYTGLTKRHLRDLREKGKLASTKVGRRVLFKVADLDALVERNYTPTR